MTYVSPDGSVTGSIHWDSLRELVAKREQEGVSDEGWARVDQLIKDHDDELKGAESEAQERAEAAADANAEAGASNPEGTALDSGSSDEEPDEEESGPKKAELQAALRERGLPTSGNKAELQQRLDESEEGV